MRAMRVAFLKAPVGGIIGLEMITFVEPLGLECVAGGLELEGHECRIFDLRIDGFEGGLAKARSFDPEIVGLQCNFTTERFRLLRLARRVKEELPEALLVVGGHDASRDPEWFLHPAIDAVAVGDGEDTMPALVAAYERGEDLARVPGLLLNRPGGPVATGPAPAREDIDELPMPARHLIADYAGEYYISFRRPLALLETARGCPFKC
ncbi:MAG TPA: cobalamin-dependent protein, partial [Thermoanaerobaculia bacterium]|nr:cobalamin-dependent protein [Thermoanaerobaculia bacterium]